MASKQNESTATDETKQTNAVAANSESILGRLVQFLVSPSLTEDFIECLVAAGEKTSGFHGRVSRETLRDNVKKYICRTLQFGDKFCAPSFHHGRHSIEWYVSMY